MTEQEIYEKLLAQVESVSLSQIIDDLDPNPRAFVRFKQNGPIETVYLTHEEWECYQPKQTLELASAACRQLARYLFRYKAWLSEIGIE